MNGGMGISKDAFLNPKDPKHRDEMLYDMISSLHNACTGCQTSIHIRLDRLERRKRIDSAVSGVLGFAGGAAMVGAGWLAGLFKK